MLTDHELRHADLGDRRLNARLRAIADALTDRPTAPLPEACAGAVDQTYRFFDNPRVTPDRIRAAHYADTAARLPAGPGPVLLASDTSWLDFSTRPGTAGLGYQQHPGQHGLFLHSTLACTAAGLPVGLLDQQAFIRPPEAFGKRATRNRRPTAEKESGRWLVAAAACQGRLPADRPAVFLADREADLFDLLAAPRRPGFDVLVRADPRRRVVGEAGLLGAVLAAAPVVGELTVEVPRRDGAPGRVARLPLRARRVVLAAPAAGPAAPGRPARLEVSAVRATEVAPPAGAAPIDWLLLTTLPLSDPGAAARWVGYYRVRWRVEQYHFTLKSGCGVEDLQLQDRRRLERAAAVYSVVAVRLLRLAYLARQDGAGSCEQEFAPVEWRVLLGAAAQQFGAAVDPTRAPALAVAVHWVARLGGYVGRGRTAGPPGVKVLWRGLRRLHDLVAGYLLQGRTHEAAPAVQSSVE